MWGKFLKENNVPSCRHNAIALYSNRGASWEQMNQESLEQREKKSEAKLQLIRNFVRIFDLLIVLIGSSLHDLLFNQL